MKSYDILLKLFFKLLHFSYSPGDVMMVHPNNLGETLSMTYKALDISDDLLDRPITLRSRETCISLPPVHLCKGKTI